MNQQISILNIMSFEQLLDRFNELHITDAAPLFVSFF